jgi:hypothetical protein
MFQPLTFGFNVPMRFVNILFDKKILLVNNKDISKWTTELVYKTVTSNFIEGLFYV